MLDSAPLKNGIEVEEISRKKSEGAGVIIATTVRQLMAQEEYEKLLHLVPETTYEIIYNNGEKDNHERPIRITSKDIRSYPDV